MQTEITQPIADNKRTAIVDILRGWAILGVAIGSIPITTILAGP